MKHSLMTRVLSLLLASVMVLGMVPVTTYAADVEQGTEPIETSVSVETTESETMAAETSEPETTEAATSATEVPETEAEETEASEPEVTEAETTEPVVTEPEATEPEETEPEATEIELVEEDAAWTNVGDVYDTSVSDEYFNVISHKEYDLAPGAVEREIILNNDDGSDRKVAHIIEVDPTNTQVEVLPGYYEIDKFDPADLTTWKTAGVTVVADYYANTLGYNVVGAMNTALQYTNNAPYGFMVYNGQVLANNDLAKGAQTYLAVIKNEDGTVEFDLRSISEPLTGNEWQAVSANFGWLVKDGALTTTTVGRTDSDASRSMLGIKEDGTLVICQVDGRNAPVSSGLSNYEMGEMMLALGCKWAVNGDGGGSSSFVTKRPGTSDLVMRSIPSDGAERPTINSIIVVSKVTEASGVFDKAVLEADTTYIAPGATMTINASGVDTNGFPMEVPADVTWQVQGETENVGTIADGVFTAAAGYYGDVLVQLVYNEAIVGELTLTVVDPDSFGFAEEATVLPYGKSMELEVVAFYGADSWAVCVDGAYTLALSDAEAATLSGSTLTATSDESKASVDVTVTYTPNPTRTDVLAVAFGKGSEIIFDFENGEEQYFMGVDEAVAWCEENGITGTIFGDGNFSENTDNYTFLSTVANGGQVKHGEKALGVTLDYTDATFASWSYNMFFYTGEGKVLRDTANGQNATTYGAWVYVPEGAGGLAMQLTCAVAKEEGAEPATTQIHFYFTTLNGEKKLLNAMTEADIPESRWIYATADLTAYPYVALLDGLKNGDLTRHPSYIRFYVKPTVAAKLTFYYDDFTLDYSSAVEDRILPTITNVTYATADEGKTLDNGTAITGNTVSFSAKVADNAGLNTASGTILVDGIAVGASVSNGVLSCGDVTLTSGEHIVTFEIQDKLGNLAKVTRTFTVSGDAVITLTGHNDSGVAAEYGSVYYADINVSDITAINSITATVKLQTANTWEPEGISVASGFTYSYSLNELSNELTVTVERDGDEALAETTTLISLPIRVWTWDGMNHVTGAEITPESQFATGYCPVVSIDCEITYGKAEYADGAFGAFGGSFTVATNLNDNLNPWHYHDSTLTTLNQDATCTAEGYTGRTYCETCQSVIDWGTRTSKTAHSYAISGDQLMCVCGKTVTGNGLVTVDGKVYCLIADKLVTGWQMVEDGWCYAAVSTKEVQTGEFSVNGLTYTADENGIVIKGAWVTDENGTKYSYGPAFYKREWAEIDGATYYFDENTYMFTGIQYIPVNRNNLKEGIIWYEFAEDGKYIGKVNGFVTYNDLKYYVVDGEFNYGGLMLIDGDYYYARSNGEVVCGKQYWITKNNDLLPVGYYTFDEDGKMVVDTEDPDEPDQPEQPETKNGIVEEDGKMYWYVNGVKTYGGLMLIDGDYYYARTSGEIVCGRSYWITKNNDLLPVGNYTFGDDGKMIDPPTTEEPDQPDQPDQPEQPETKNGIVEEDGKLYWYEDGVKTYGGLMLIDGDYYYARTSGEIICGQSYWITKNNDLLPVGNYTFGDDGKMIDPPTTEEPEQPDQPDQPEQPETKNGIVEEDGKKYWYVDGVKTYGGLVLVDGDYYYARTSGEIVCGKSYWITKTNDLLPAGYYTFDADGKLVQ